MLSQDQPELIQRMTSDSSASVILKGINPLHYFYEVIQS